MVANLNPGIATAITTAMGDGTLEMVGIVNQDGQEEYYFGKADSDTIGLDLEGWMSPTDLAAVLIHEYAHWFGFNNTPGYGTSPDCDHADAYAQEADALDAMSCETSGWDKPSCTMWEHATNQYHLAAAKCEIAGGTPTTPNCDTNAPALRSPPVDATRRTSKCS